MTEAQEDYGEKIAYDPQWQGPLKIARKPTDSQFTYCMGVYLILWIGIAIFAFVKGGIEIPPADDEFAWNSEISHNSIVKQAPVILGFSLFTIFLTLIYMFLLKQFTKVFVYISIFLLCLLLFTAVCVLFYYSRIFPGDYQYSALAIVIAIIFIGIVVCVIIFRKKIEIACGVIKVACKAVFFFPSSLIFPILPYILYGIVIIFTLVTYILLSSLNQQYHVALVDLLHLVNIFGGFWFMCFVTAFNEMVLSGTFATYYWTRNKDTIPNVTILIFISITIRYHFGTLAFGSLIIATCKMIQFLIRSVQNQSDSNSLSYSCGNIMMFCCSSIEQFLRYINHNAYIMTTIHGTKFGESAKSAFNLLMRNIIKVIVITDVTQILLMFAQISIIALSIAATYGYCIKFGDASGVMIAIVGVAISGIAITASFFLVLDLAIDTIFLCVLEDFERNDGSTARPYYMSTELKDLLIKN